MLILLFSTHLILDIPWLLTICFLLNQIRLLALGTLFCLFFGEKMQKKYIFSHLLLVAFDWVIGFLALFLFLFPLLSLYQYFVNNNKKTTQKTTREGNNKPVLIRAAA